MRINKIEGIISICGKIELIGSNSDENIEYKTDYDFQEVCLGKNDKERNLQEHRLNTELVKKFQSIFRQLKNLDDAYIVDFKAGMSISQPIRWNYSEIMQGYKFIDVEQVNLIDCLHNNDNKVKLDIISYIDGEYKEISCNYYFTMSEKNVSDIHLSLMLDIKKYYREKKYMKMYKRIYSYRSLKKQSVDELVDMFNTKIGYLNMLSHKIDVVQFIQDNSVVEKDNRFKVDKMIKKIYTMVPDKLQDIKSLSLLQTHLNQMINKLIEKYYLHIL